MLTISGDVFTPRENSAKRVRNVSDRTEHRERSAHPVEHSASHELLRSVAAGSDVGLLVLDEDGVVSEANAAAEYLLGRSQDEIVGEKVLGAVGVVVGRHEINSVSADDRVRFLELRVASDGEGRGYVATLTDITDYREETNDARQEVRRRDSFLATLSHELRNPLSAVSGGFDLMKAEAFDPAVCAQTVPIVERQLFQLRRLLDDLLDTTRVSRGQVSLQLERVDVRDVLSDAVEMVGLLGKETLSVGSRLDVQPGSAPLFVVGDRVRLRQAVSNLMVNALKYTPEPGRVYVRASVESALCRSRPARTVVVRVTDEGAGIAPDVIGQVFEPFMQVERTAGTRQGGFGIGLTLVRQIASLHGGVIEAESDGVGHGSTFTLRLPAAEESGPGAGDGAAGDDGAADVEAAVHAPPKPLRILLVEDVPALRMITGQLLEANGHTVVTAGDADEAIAAVRSDPFDLALVDIGLPGPSGHDLVQEIIESLGEDRPKLVALTGYGQDSDREKSFLVGFDEHLNKPFDVREFREMLPRLFNES